MNAEQTNQNSIIMISYSIRNVLIFPKFISRLVILCLFDFLSIISKSLSSAAGSGGSGGFLASFLISGPS